MAFDLLLKGGTLVDPEAGKISTIDIAFSHGLVAAVQQGLPTSDAMHVVDCSEHYLCAGFIDLHVHAYLDVSHYGIDADRYLLRRGVTTAVDAGSAGADTYPGFCNYVIQTSKTRLFSFLNISSIGLLNPDVGELEDLRYADVSKAVRMIEENRKTIKGVKVRLSRKFVNRSAGITPLRLAIEAAEATSLPVMVHPQNAQCSSIDEILSCMRHGDILTHCFHGGTCGILNRDGKIRNTVWEAMEKGIIFDVGHGRGSFVWEIAEQALSQGFSPQTISTDLHRYNIIGPVYNLLHTVSKFLHLGIGLLEAIGKVTSTPAAVLGQQGNIGILAPGASGDALIFDIGDGSIDFRDSRGGVRVGNRFLNLKLVVRGGSILYDGFSSPQQ